MGIIPIKDSHTWNRDVIQSNIPVLVVFWTKIYGQRGWMDPIVEELSEYYTGKVKFVKVNVGKADHLAPQCRVKRRPMYVLFDRGEIVSRQVTKMTSKKSLKAMIDEVSTGTNEPTRTHRTTHLRAIDDQVHISEIQGALRKQIEQKGRYEKKIIGYKDERRERNVCLLNDYKIWWSYDRRDRHRNAFGIYDNTRDWTDNDGHIVCEINPPTKSDRSRGVFVTNGKKTYIAHTGQFTRDLNGEKYTTELSRYHIQNLDLQQIEWYDGTQKDVVMISALDDDHFIANIKKFVEGVYKHKERGSIPKNEKDDKQYELWKCVDNMSMEEVRKKLTNRIKSTESLVYVASESERDSKATQCIKKNRGYRCQICNEGIVKKNSNLLYVEAAHIKPKKDGGNETPDNIIILCPNHHVEFDMGDRKIIKHTKTTIEFILNGQKHKIRLDE